MKTLYTALCTLIAFSSFAQGITLPYFTGFDSPTEQNGWISYQTEDQSIYDWSFGGGGSSLPTCLSHDYNVGASSTDTLIDWMVSPALDLSSPWQVSMLVRRSGFSIPFVDNCEVWYSAGSADPNDGEFILLGNISFVSPQFEWVDTLFAGPALNSNSHIAFKYKTIGAAWSTYNIDDVLISEAGLGIAGELKDKVVFYPSPAKDALTIDLPETWIYPQVELIDFSGKIMLLHHAAQAGRQIIDITNVPSGSYLVRCTGQRGEYLAGQLVVQK